MYQPIITFARTTITYDAREATTDPLEHALETGQISYRRYKAIKASSAPNTATA